MMMTTTTRRMETTKTHEYSFDSLTRITTAVPYTEHQKLMMAKRNTEKKERTQRMKE